MDDAERCRAGHDGHMRMVCRLIMWMFMFMFLVVIMKVVMITRMKMIISVACGGAFGCRVD